MLAGLGWFLRFLRLPGRYLVGAPALGGLVGSPWDFRPLRGLVVVYFLNSWIMSRTFRLRLSLLPSSRVLYPLSLWMPRNFRACMGWPVLAISVSRLALFQLRFEPLIALVMSFMGIYSSGVVPCTLLL